MYNVVLIGCGHMGSVHLDDIYMMKDICVYGVQALPTIDDVYKSLDIAIKTDESLIEKYIN